MPRLPFCASAAARLALLALLLPATQAFKLRDPINPANDKRPDQYGPYRHWDLREMIFCKVPFGVANNCRDVANVVPAVDSALASWTAVLPSRLFIINQGAADSALGGDSKNSIFWDNSNMTGLFTFGDGTIGITIVTYKPGGAGILSEADIVMNDEEFLWTRTKGDSLAAARIFSTTPGPWDFDQDDDSNIDHNVLNIRLRGNQNRVVTFTAADFADLDAGTRVEVRNAINAQVGNYIANHRVFAQSYANNQISIEDLIDPVDNTYVEMSVQVTGGSANANFGFPVAKKTGNARVDVQTIALHELGHAIGMAHTNPNTVPVMNGFAPNLGTKIVLTADDRAGCSFLYSPEIGDAEAGTYPSYVQNAVPGRTLNGVQLKTPGPGAMHLNGTNPGFQYVRLGPDLDAECESNQVDNDRFDDGVNVIPPLALPGNYIVQVNMTVAPDDSGRALSGGPDNLYHMNGWFDFNGNGVWDEPAEHLIQFASIATANNQYILTPAENLNARSFWARFRVDYGEDCGAVGNTNGDLNGVRGVAQYGEVEDYLFDFNIVPVELESFLAVDEGQGATLSWRIGLEREVLGYNLLRSVDGGPRARVNDALIRARGTRAGARDYLYTDPGVPPEGRVQYWIEELGTSGRVNATLGPVDLSRRPLVAQLLPPFPNPVRGSVAIRFVIDRARTARVDVFDLSGRLVRTLATGPMERGPREVSWDTRDAGGAEVPNGLYYVRLTLDDGWKTTRKVTVAR